ncbi:ubiquitin-activating enzyme 1 [Artemisia annua]|uniref:Ubiquitin-activating enzyme 1 n=1 Tax=Artemisia annua TaxID=35608 RepID=A0A2U1LTU0_ARTAN|nr:ubiquitin-activating enzyme 1 [Artemisia annua]
MTLLLDKNICNSLKRLTCEFGSPISRSNADHIGLVVNQFAGLLGMLWSFYNATQTRLQQKLASLNEKLDTLERRLELLEVQVGATTTLISPVECNLLWNQFLKETEDTITQALAFQEKWNKHGIMVIRTQSIEIIKHQDLSWTVWDRWTTKGNPTLRELIKWLADKGLDAYSISCGRCLLFNNMFPRYKERMYKKVVDLARDVAKMEIMSNRRHLDLLVACEDEEENDIDIPRVNCDTEGDSQKRYAWFCNTIV